MSTSQGLTPKQEAFVKAYLETGNASEAYRRSYGAKNYGENALNVQASKMLKHPKIVLRIAELQERAAKRHDITVDSITEMLKEDRELARELEMPAAAVSAAMGLAKLHGLVTDKKHVTSDNRHTHSAEPLSPFAEHLAEVLGIGPEGKAERPLQN